METDSDIEVAAFLLITKGELITCPAHIGASGRNVKTIGGCVDGAGRAGSPNVCRRVARYRAEGDGAVGQDLVPGRRPVPNPIDSNGVGDAACLERGIQNDVRTVGLQNGI